jgi:hypothetical protein
VQVLERMGRMLQVRRAVARVTARFECDVRGARQNARQGL